MEKDKRKIDKIKIKKFKIVNRCIFFHTLAERVFESTNHKDC
jgi:hypothetical protein